MALFELICRPGSIKVLNLFGRRRNSRAETVPREERRVGQGAAQRWRIGLFGDVEKKRRRRAHSCEQAFVYADGEELEYTVQYGTRDGS